MAKKFLVDIDLNKLELQNAVIQNLASDPSNPVAGQVYFNTTTHRFRVYTGTEWNEGGTVTSVSIENAEDGGLTVTDSPITSSGVITIGHSNILNSAQTTQSVYPITIDKNGHIASYGEAVTIPEAQIQSDWNQADDSKVDYIKNKPTIPTKTSDLTNDSDFITSSTDTLTNYYKKSETYNKTQIYNLLSWKVDNTTLNDYYTKTRTDELLGGKVDTSTYNSKMTQIDTSLGNKANISDIPTKTSDLTNDSDFITKAYVDGLVGDIGEVLDEIQGESV